MLTRVLSAAVPALALLSLSGTPQDPGRQDPAGRRGVDMPDLVAALEKTEGCLGVDAGRMRSGKEVIFAWFEDKAAVLGWYRGRTHRGVIRDFVTDRDKLKEPLEFIADDSGPIMVIASLTTADKPHFAGLKMPVSQIAIELYQPLPGGSYFGSRFTPMVVEIEGSRDYTTDYVPRPKEAASGKDGKK